MKERPILMSAPMVNAILAGRKTQTRRIMKPQPTRVAGVDSSEGASIYVGFLGSPIMLDVRFVCPHGRPGSRLWVKETFAPSVDRENHAHAKAGYTYRADWSCDDDRDVRDFQWKPSIFCTRAASRITLEITGIGVERLQDISEEDAKAEGVVPRPDQAQGAALAGIFGAKHQPYASAYANLWESINGPGSWDANPWVWVIEFKRVEATP